MLTSLRKSNGTKRNLSAILINKWDKRFIELAQQISTWSKDPRATIGCVIVKDKRILATGYNGLPSCVKDTQELLNNKELKRTLMVHAEVNAILNAGKHGISLVGATIYVYGLPPCANCVKTIMSSGIVRLVYKLDDIEHSPEWYHEFAQLVGLLTECGVKVDALPETK